MVYCINRVTLVLLLTAGVLSAQSTPPSGSAIVVPPGWVCDTYISGLAAPYGLKNAAHGDMLVGDLYQVLQVSSKGTKVRTIATGTFLALFMEIGRDGTLYIADPENPGRASLWAVPPGQTEPYAVATDFRYCQGIVQLPDGDLLAVDPGWIGLWEYNGKVLRIPSAARNVSAWDMPHEIENLMRNPIAIEFGPDGSLYLLDRGMYYDEPGWMLRWKPGQTLAETFIPLLNDPRDFAWAKDGSLFITDRNYGRQPGGVILRRDPNTGALEEWATGFRGPWGIEIGPDGDIFVTDPDAGCVYRIHPASPAPTRVNLSFEPETLSLSSNGQDIMANLLVYDTSLTRIAITAVNDTSITPIAATETWTNSNGVHAKFSRAAVQSVLTPGTATLRLEGVFANGVVFYATGSLRVTGK